MKRLVIDLDNTLTVPDKSLSYDQLLPNLDMINQLNIYRKKGFQIVIYTSRNMNKYSNSVGKINANTLPIIIFWLEKHKIHFDEIYIGKPWCGEEGFYVDDKAIRPKEFLELDYEQIQKLINTNSINNND